MGEHFHFDIEAARHGAKSLDFRKGELSGQCHPTRAPGGRGPQVRLIGERQLGGKVEPSFGQRGAQPRDETAVGDDEGVDAALPSAPGQLDGMIKLVVKQQRIERQVDGDAAQMGLVAQTRQVF